MGFSTISIAAVILSLAATAPAGAQPAADALARLRALEAKRETIEAIAGMAEMDVALRNAMLAITRDLPPAERDAVYKPAGELISHADRQHIERLKAIIDKDGWPTISATSERTSLYAVRIVNHGAFDHAFQVRVLALMEPLVASRGVRPEDYARLYDRVAVHENRPQRYGAQGTTCRDHKLVTPADVEAPEGLDERRAGVGLEPMATYLVGLNKMYGGC